MKLQILHDDVMVKAPIIDSPGFEKKDLSQAHMDLARRCAASCTYCSTNEGYPARMNRERLHILARVQLGIDVDPTRDPGISIAWNADEVMRRLREQIASKPKGWGRGKVLMVSQLTDPFFGYPYQSGLTRRALDLVFDKTEWRVRVLTKCDVVGRDPLLGYFREHKDRVVVGLSTGTMDDAWVSKVELATSKPSARLRALRNLQDAGVPTFAMWCPIFPQAVLGDRKELDALIDASRPDVVEQVWAEPFNDRGCWRNVQAGYEQGSAGWNWFEHVYNRANGSAVWSRYATELYAHLYDRASRGGWLKKLAYLLYEDQITAPDAVVFSGLEGVLLQSKPIVKRAKGATADNKDAGYSPNQHIAKLQRDPNHGRVAVKARREA